jgi:hypothetical protein
MTRHPADRGPPTAGRRVASPSGVLRPSAEGVRSRLGPKAGRLTGLNGVVQAAGSEAAGFALVTS